MSEAELARGVILAHGSMADGLVSAVRRIAGGAAEALIAVSNDARSPAELKAMLDDLARQGPLVVFADLQSGSCGMAALSSCRQGPGCAVVCGVNLPILLDFVFHRDLPLDELLPRLVAKGRQAILPASGPG